MCFVLYQVAAYEKSLCRTVQLQSLFLAKTADLGEMIYHACMHLELILF